MAANGNGETVAGIGRRRGAAAAAAGGTSARVSLAVGLASCSLSLCALALGGVFLAPPPPRRGSRGSAAGRRRRRTVAAAADGAGDDDAAAPAATGLEAVLRAEWDLVDVDASAMRADDDDGGRGGGRGGVRGRFCRLDWARYKRDPPSLPMFKMLVSSAP